jgi:MFS family permease
MKALKITLLLTSMLTMMAGAVVAPALPSIQEAFDGVEGNELLTRLIITLPALFMRLLSPIAGYIIDKIGRLKLLIFSLILYAISGTSGYFLNDLYLILIGRAVLGIAVAGILNTVLTLIGDYMSGKERNSFMGYQGAFAGFGGVVFIGIAGLLAEVNWHLPFSLYLFSLIDLVLVLIFLYEPEKPPKTNKEISVTKLNKKYIKLFLVIDAIGFVGIVFFYMVPVQIPFMLDNIGVSKSLIGWTISIFSLSQALLSIFYGKIKSRLSFKEMFFFSFLLMASGYFIISLADKMPFYFVGLILAGFGTGLFMPNGNLWIISLAPMQVRGRFVSYLSMASFFGMFLSPVIIQPIIKRTSISGSFLIASIIMLLIALVFLYRRKNDLTR